MTASTQAAIDAIRRRWATYHDRGAHDYTDEGCRVLTEHAFRDIPALLAALSAVEADLRRKEEKAAVLREALERTRDWLKFAANSEGGIITQTIDAALAVSPSETVPQQAEEEPRPLCSCGWPDYTDCQGGGFPCPANPEGSL